MSSYYVSNFLIIDKIFTSPRLKIIFHQSLFLNKVAGLRNIFKLVLTKSFSQNVSDLRLKILLFLIIEKLCWHLFFVPVLEKLQSCCLIETNQSSKYCFAKEISKLLTICITSQIKWHSLRKKCPYYIGPYFPAFELNTERHEVKCGKYLRIESLFTQW